ncbi:MAG: hypothetical protein RQM92_02375 [Candidatus Syntrophopropionicum ammoniitolerans]
MATTVCFSMQELKAIPKLIKISIFKELPDEAVLIENLIDLSDSVRREGILYLEKQHNLLKTASCTKGFSLLLTASNRRWCA